MGYTTTFSGAFYFESPVPEKIIKYINDFSRTRHMKRSNKIIREIYPEWKLRSWNGSLGKNGEYFLDVDSNVWAADSSVLDINSNPKFQPGLWCHWIISDDGKRLGWDGAEKFYSYIEWLDYLIENFFCSSDLILNGTVEWQGEDEDDKGSIIVSENIITVKKAAS